MLLEQAHLSRRYVDPTIPQITMVRATALQKAEEQPPLAIGCDFLGPTAAQNTHATTAIKKVRSKLISWDKQLNYKASGKRRWSNRTLSILKPSPESPNCSSAFPVGRWELLLQSGESLVLRGPGSADNPRYFCSCPKATNLLSMLGSATTWRLSRELPSLICRNKTSFWERTERTQPYR